MPTPRVCELEQCGRTYVPKPKHRPDQRFCSKSCAQSWRNLTQRPSARPDSVSRAEWERTRQLAKSRARRLRHAQTWDGITDDEILERDGWRCQVPGCKRRPIRRDLKYPHLRSKSVDHIVPISLGGDDTAANKRAAHLGCNMARGDQMGEEQVALFGSIREALLATLTVGERAAMFKPRAPRKKRFCKCGAKPQRGYRACQACRDQRATEAEARRAEKAQSAPAIPVHYYTCRYCGDLKVARGTGQLREVCPDRPCQMGRLMANNLRTREGVTAEDADALVIARLAAGTGPGYGRWRRGAA